MSWGKTMFFLICIAISGDWILVSNYMDTAGWKKWSECFEATPIRRWSLPLHLTSLDWLVTWFDQESVGSHLVQYGSFMLCSLLASASTLWEYSVILQRRPVQSTGEGEAMWRRIEKSSWHPQVSVTPGEKGLDSCHSSAQPQAGSEAKCTWMSGLRKALQNNFPANLQTDGN